MIKIIKANGKIVPFAPQKLQRSLRRAGASSGQAREIVTYIKSKLRDGQSTKQIYNQAFKMLQRMDNNIPAVRYSLKEAIRALGPTGYPFEQFIGRLFEIQGYDVEVGQTLQGKCVSHEMDVIAKKGNEYILAEAKFRNRAGDDINIRVPLYMNSRFTDILANELPPENNPRCIIISNTHFTEDAIQYVNCNGNIELIGWRYPADKGLVHMIESAGLQPVTILSMLNDLEHAQLLKRGVVTCRDIVETPAVLSAIGLSKQKAAKVHRQSEALCQLKVK